MGTYYYTIVFNYGSHVSKTCYITVPIITKTLGSHFSYLEAGIPKFSNNSKLMFAETAILLYTTKQ